jgi:hypothetical protein
MGIRLILGGEVVYDCSLKEDGIEWRIFFNIIEKEGEAERVGEVVDHGKQNGKFPVTRVDITDFWF